MTTTNSFSVLMSVYYREEPKHLEQALASNLINQTLIPNEFILVHNGELTPELDAVIERFKKMFPEILKVCNKKFGGLGEALNFGLGFCTNELIARSDSDDICMPFRFEKQVKFMVEHPEIDLCSSWIDEFEKNPGDSTLKRLVPETPEEITLYAQTRCPVNHPSVIFRKEAVVSVGGYQVKYVPEDYFLWIKMIQNGSKIFNIQESLVWFRFSPDTFKRRGGWKYACDEVKTQINIYKMGFIQFPILCRNIFIRFTTRLMPNFLREYLYKKYLRNK